MSLRRVLGAGALRVAEVLGVFMACAAAVMGVFPRMRRPGAGQLFVDWHDTYGMGLAQGTDMLQLSELFVMGWGAPHRLCLPAGLVLAVALGSAAGWRRPARWLPAAASALLLLSISLGPSEGLAPYTVLMEQLPLMRAAPRPTRYALGGAVSLCLWLGLALSEASRRWPRAPGGLALVLAAGVLLQGRPYQEDRPLLWPQLPPIARLAEEPLILELPLVFQEPQSQLALIAASPTPRMNPAASRLNDWQRVVEDGGYPLLRAALALQWGQTPDLAALQALAERVPERALGLRYVVLHTRAIPPGQEARWAALIAALPLEPVEEAAGRVVYALTDAPQAGQPEVEHGG